LRYSQDQGQHQRHSQGQHQGHGQGQHQMHSFPRLVIASIEATASQDFYDSFSQVPYQIDRIIIDEAHLIHLAASYRTVMHQLKHLPSIGVPLVLASATVTPSTLAGIEQNLLIQQTHVIREPIRNPRIHYGVQKITSSCDNHYDYTMDYIQTRQQSFPLQRVIVYCMTKADVRAFSHQFRKQVSIYTSDLDESLRAKELDDFTSGRKSILVGTSAIGAGYDFSDISLVIFLHGAWSFNDFIQGSGRMARSPDSSGDCITLVRPNGFNPSVSNAYLRTDTVDVQAMKDFINTEGCRRQIINQVYDNVIMTCQSNDIKCDYCQQARFDGQARSSQIWSTIKSNEWLLQDALRHLSNGICLICYIEGDGR
jgi:superfamily II DNA helicase RecQ